MSMIMESQTLPNIEGKEMEFSIDVMDAQFNHEGWYYLVITLHNSFIKDYSQVKVMKGTDGIWESKRQLRTDSTKQEENVPLSYFKDRRFTFRFPKGFYKNDKNHDVYVLVEAYTSADSPSGKGRKVGEGKFAIYPRPNAPRMKLYAEPGEDYYNYTGVMSLLRTHSTDNIQMHCGRIRNNYSMREVLPPKRKTPPPPTPPTQRSLERKLTPIPSPRQTPRPTPLPNIRSPDTKDSGRKHVEPAPYTQQVVPPTPASSWGENLSLDLNLPKSPPLPPAADGKKLPEKPLPDSDRHTFSTDRLYRHVSNAGDEHIEVIVHGASSLPLTPDGQVPQPYAVVKTKKLEDNNTKSDAVTHTSVRPTHAPSWEEMVTLNINQKTAEDETVVVSVGDGQTQKCLVNYRMPVVNLTPFHQYHLELNMPAKGIPSGVKTFASITRKLPRLPVDPSSPNYLALEVLLMSAQRPIQNPLGPLIAVARIVPDYYNYKSDNLLNHPRNAGVVMQSVTFPSAHPSSFIVTERSHHGHPQLSLPGRPENQPTWNHPYLFVEKRDKATLFTPGAALVIEYYVASTTMSDQFWRMQSPVAFSTMLMDEEMYKNLIADRAKNGLRIEGVPIQGSEMSTIDGRRPTVGMILKLITTETPDSMVSVSNIEDIPSLELFPDSDVPGYYRADSPEILKLDSPTKPAPKEEPLSPARTPKTPPSAPHQYHYHREPAKTNPGRYLLQKVKKRPMSPTKDGEMPSYNAMEQLLPDYQYIFQPGEGMPGGGGGTRSPTRRPPGPSTSHVPAGGYDGEEAPLDKNSMVLIDHQTKELGNYRDAVHKMGSDILTLRSQMRDLEGINSNLRRDLAHYSDTTRLMVDSAELDGLTKPEVLSRYAALKQTLASQTVDLKTYKDKLQKAQNDLIKKNDDEKKFLKIQKAHASQQMMIQKLQDKLKKMKKLEEACKKQESVISQMEKVLERHHRDRGRYQKDKASQDANEVLLQENKRLRDQIDELRMQIRNSGSNANDDLEKMELYQALEKAEGRIASLENQLAQNSRDWGKERAALNIRLNEAEHAFGRHTSTVFHDFPVVTAERRGGLKRLSPVYN
ncbi:coiled-coil domain-containing protein 33-like isoform X2 [Ruditapes philippinarum]|uniref:coiled-coil domain-containing protein 33-like isoform X2 n=1 Tax=Ruditapes philippinarum TaxID=129788 RepID=UPI00295B2521|nr:coiled-coil domain-containing protein 33-like isoform X2 [Ruditapes philippinarum]